MPHRSSEGLIVFALWLLVFSASSQIMIMSPILLRIGEELDITDAVLGTLVSAYALMVGVFAIIAGPVSDKIGRRRILLLGTAALTVALSLHHFISGYMSFLVLRVLAGMAGGILSGAAVSYVGDYFPYARRGWAIGWVMSGAAFGHIAGIPIGILLAGAFGFRAPFYLFAVTMALTYLLIWAKVPQPDVKRTEGRLTLKRAVTGYAELLRQKEIAAAVFAFFMMFLGLSFYVVYFPTWLERSLGATSGRIAILFMVGGIANVIAGPQAGKLSDRIGRKKIVILSCVCLSITMLLTTVLVREFWMAYPLFFAVMILVAMRISPFSALLTALADDEHRGSLLSLTVALGQVGFAFGGAVAGPLFAQYGYWSNTILAAVSVLGMGVIVWLMVPEPELHPAMAAAD